MTNSTTDRIKAGAWAPGTKMQTIIVDGWSRGFQASQTLHECIQAGYSACVAAPAITARWAQMDQEMFAAQDKDRANLLATERAKRIGKYLAYWDRSPLPFHEIDCPNPCCDQRLKLAKPTSKREVWDSLATCPYCNGTFFYESRVNSVEADFKGFF